jgi:phosphoribosylanthranilate isomerase
VVRVKICGITNLEDAQAAIKVGADALGFVFYKKSPRYINPQEARRILKHLPKKILKVGVFVNAKKKVINDIARLCRLDLLQFHGSESMAFCKNFRNYKVIKAFRIKDKGSLKKLKRYSTWAFLFDAYRKGLFGGTGRKFDWRIIRDLKLNKRHIFLSGGLKAGNVKEAVKLIRPDWVDTSSSLEIRPGKKDHGKIKEFIKAAKQ